MDHAKKYLLPFFLMVFIFQIPFLVLHELYGTELLPKLPLSALTFLTPCLAASILVYRNGGAKGLWYFLGRAFDFRKIKKPLWYLPLFTFYPTIVFISYLLLRFENVSVPNVKADPLNVISLCFLFFIAGMIEEIGWTGYVTDPLQKKVWPAKRWHSAGFNLGNMALGSAYTGRPFAGMDKMVDNLYDFGTHHYDLVLQQNKSQRIGGFNLSYDT